MTYMKPKLAILDELDSGVDPQALKFMCEKINKLKEETGMSILVITHYPHILEYLKPDFVHNIENGKLLTKTT